MSIVTTLEATPNRIAIVFRTLRARGEDGISEQELLKLLCPSNVSGGPGGDDSLVARHVLTEVQDLKMMTVQSNSVCHLVSELQRSDDGNFFSWLETTLLNPKNAEETHQAQFTAALAWFLELDPSLPFEFSDNVSELVKTQVGPDVESFDLTNRSRSQNFAYWARYLGFAWWLEVGGATKIIPDPTVALERHVPRLFAKGEKALPVSELLDRWSGPLPILEGGNTRSAILERLRKNGGRDELTLSRSTSLALRRLANRRLIGLERRADALAYTLDTRPNPTPVSHVVAMWEPKK